MDENDLTQEKEWYYEQRSKLVVTNLQKRGMNAQYFPSRREAKAAILKMIPAGVKVARGDSISVDQVGVIVELVNRGQNTLIDPLKRADDGSFSFSNIENRKSIAREAFTADIFLVGVNAVTLDGKLVSTDAWGNRVAATVFGPEKVIVVAGANKIVKGVDEALERIHSYAAPMNAKRHALKHGREDFAELPCARTGICIDCNHPWRICRYTVIIEGSMLREKDRINVVLVGEELGI